MNAADVYPDRLLTWQREVDDLARLGYSSDELDLRDYWGARPSELAEVLADASLVWVVGGNAFVLARAAEAAGLRLALDLAPGITYGGYSAGACLTSIDLQGIELMDDPAALPTGYTDGMPMATLNLSGTRLIPHAGSSEANAATRRLTRRDLDFRGLRDGEDVLYGSWQDL